MLKGNRIVLREIEEKDLEWTRDVRNKFKDSFFDASYISREKQKEFFNKTKEYKEYFFIIEHKSGDRMGTIALYNIRERDRTADIGRVLLLKEYQNYGYMKEALELITEFAFQSLRLFRLKVAVHLDNIEAITLYGRAGFKTSTRPIILMEKIDKKKDRSYDDLSSDGYESQCSNTGD